MKKYTKGNEGLTALIQDMKKSAYDNSAPIWRDVAERLSRPSKNHAEVNISSIARYAEKGEVILVPGKLLGSGEIGVPVTVASYGASSSAIAKIKTAGGRVITIRELMHENPKGSGVRIMR